MDDREREEAINDLVARRVATAHAWNRDRVAAAMERVGFIVPDSAYLDTLLSKMEIEIVILQTKLEEAEKTRASAIQGRREFRAAYHAELEDNRQLRAALAAVRVKALPAGAAVGLRREGWEERCREVLDIIDAALAAGEKAAVSGPSLLRPAVRMEPNCDCGYSGSCKPECPRYEQKMRARNA